MNLDDLKPKHGVEVKFDLTIKKDKDLICRLVQLQNECGVLLLILLHELNNINNNSVKVRCRQCLKDITLQFQDLTNTLKEMSEHDTK